MKRKVRKFSQGGYGDSFSEDSGMGTREEMIERNIEENERRRQAEQLKPSTTLAEFEEPGTAGFSRAPVKPPVRPTVKTPAVTPKAPPVATPKAPPVRPVSSGRGTMSGPTAAQLEEGRKKFAEDEGRRNLQRLQREDKPLERVNPEANLMGGPALRGAKAMATGLREAADFVKQRMARSAAPSAVKQLGQSGRQAENLTKDMGPVEFAAGKRSMLQNQRGEGVITPPAAPFAERNKRMLMQNQRGEGVITPPAPVRPPRGGGRDPEARRPTQDELDQMRMGSDYMRKGGRVKAYKSGGSVSSASKRADGIAMRGKTRGKYI